MPAAPARHPALHRPRQSMPPKFLTAVPAAVHKRIFMTADQDTPVAASAAPDTMEKETPKPRRRAAPRQLFQPFSLLRRPCPSPQPILFSPALCLSEWPKPLPRRRAGLAKMLKCINIR